VNTATADPGVAHPALAVAAIAGLLVAFVARPLLDVWTDDPTVALVALFSVLLIVAVAWPATTTPRAGGWTVVVLMGAAAFVVGRLIGGGHPPALLSARVLALNSLAAVAEEAFFRKLIYAVLRPGGAVLAVAGSATLFALAHVTVYGWWVLPLDLAAGVVLSWQRWASGSWTAPAVTHVVANVLVIL
jgi:membrane protease YdiL (CAAX protease family)